jgi:protein subunit release factor A
LERRRQGAKRSQEQSTLKSVLASWEKHQADLAEARFFLDVAKDEKSDEALGEAASKVDAVTKEMAQTELTQLLGEPDDRRNAIVTLHPGAGAPRRRIGRNSFAHVSALVRPARFRKRFSTISRR